MTEPAQARTGPGRAPVVLRSLRGYRRSWLAADVLAAVTLLAIAVPEQLATSRLAGMPPVTGFYAFVAGTVLFALLGSNPRMSVGADSTIAPLFAVGVARFAASGTPGYQDLVGDPGGDGRRAGGAGVAGAAGLDLRAAVGPDHHRLPRRDRGDHHRPPAPRPARVSIPRAARRFTGSGPWSSHLGHVSVATLVIGLGVFARRPRSPSGSTAGCPARWWASSGPPSSSPRPT